MPLRVVPQCRLLPLLSRTGKRGNDKALLWQLCHQLVEALVHLAWAGLSDGSSHTHTHTHTPSRALAGTRTLSKKSSLVSYRHSEPNQRKVGILVRSMGKWLIRFLSSLMQLC